MKEKYESLALVQLKELAKVRGMKGTSTMKKADLIAAMLEEDKKDKEKEEKEKREKREKKEKQEGVAVQRTNTGKTEKKEQTAVKNETIYRAEESSTQKSEGTNKNNKNQSSRNNNNNGNKNNNNSKNNSNSNHNGGTGSSNNKGSNGNGSSNGGNANNSNSSANNGGNANSSNNNSGNNGGSANSSNNNSTNNGGNANNSNNNSTNNGGNANSNSNNNGNSSNGNGGNSNNNNRLNEVYDEKNYPKELDSGEEASGILEVMPDGYGFIRCENYLPGDNDVYVAPSQIRRFGLKTGDILKGNKRVRTQQEKFSALLFIRSVNGYTPEQTARRKNFEDMTPIFPNERIKLETPGCSIAMRAMDLVSPVGKGQRGMIVSPPKAGKTTLLKEVAKSILRANPKMHMLILLIDERPEEVTDIKEAIVGNNVEVIYSTFDELPDHHKRVSEMVIERAKRLVEHKEDVVILLDSITRLTRAYNLVVPPSGRTLSGGLDPAALHMPKRFFGAARNMREGGSLTILATALVETGSKMDDVVYEEFKGTGNMEIVLDRKLSEKRIFPAIDLSKSSTRREDLLLDTEELEAINIMRKALNGLKPDEATDRILDMFAKTKNNDEFVQLVKKNKFI